MLRTILIYLSQADWMRRLVMGFGLARRVALRFVAGETLEEAITRVDAATGSAPAYYAINCCHPTEFSSGLNTRDWIKRVGGLMPNAVAMDTLSLCSLGHIEDGDPEELGGQMADLARRFPHINVWGGCCGTDGRHIGQISRQVGAARRQMAAE